MFLANPCRTTRPLALLERREVLAGLGAAAIAWPARAQSVSADPDHQSSTVLPAELAQLLASPMPPLLFDVREPAEFAVSRIAGAISVPPSTDYAEFVVRHGEASRGRTAVFYCTTAARSSVLALGVEDALLQSGAQAVRVLAGGLVAWHNEQRPLTNDAGATDAIHPFQTRLLRLLKRPASAIRLQDP
jgi:rhodanese-related sulfurtransferase